jgi:hypothetical protein
MTGNRALRLIVTVSLVLLPGLAMAQSATTGAIAGTVKDATGAVVPGVTVEASSPALIERVRTAVSDDQGNYKIVDLRPGTYTANHEEHEKHFVNFVHFVVHPVSRTSA